MTGELAATALPARQFRPTTDFRRVAVVAGIVALAIPTILSLARIHWSTEDGAHGPIILVSGLWLFWREREHIHFRPGAIAGPWLLILAPLLALYGLSRSVGFLGTETASLWLILVLLGFYYWGPVVMRRLWFAVLYLGFLIKPPYGLVEQLTQPLKIGISETSVEILHLLGYPIAASGVLIQVGQYELLVKQACAGLGSLFTLLAIGLLYIHLTSAGRTRGLILMLAILPIALLANLLRVIILVLLTYHAGDAVAQSFAHDVAGVATFALSVAGMLALNWLLDRRWTPQ